MGSKTIKETSKAMRTVLRVSSPTRMSLLHKVDTKSFFGEWRDGLDSNATGIHKDKLQRLHADLLEHYLSHSSQKANSLQPR